MFQPGKREIGLGIYKLIDGVWHKRCNGPGHDEPTYLPANEKYFYVRKGWGQGSFTARCRLCNNWQKLDNPGPDTQTGFIEVSKVHHIYAEAVNRIGLTELSLRSGVGRQHIYKVLNYKLVYVRKSNLRAIMLELISIRRKGEYSVNRHALWRLSKRGNGFDARYCKGCGILISEDDKITVGCLVCVERQRKREKRSDPKNKKKEAENRRIARNRS